VLMLIEVSQPADKWRWWFVADNNTSQGRIIDSLRACRKAGGRVGQTFLADS